MIRRTWVAAGLSMVIAGLAWANSCPLCLQDIPAGEKYCMRHKQEMLVKTATANDEKKALDELTQARADYKAKLDKMKDFYVMRGRAAELGKVDAEIKGFTDTPHFTFNNWDDMLSELSATTPTPEADKLLKEADEARKGWNPLKADERSKAAAAKYQDIVIKYPRSTAVEKATYALGEIYSSRGVAEYPRAVHFFDLCYLSNTDTSLDALYRAAQVSAEDLADYENAARYYWLAARTSKDSGVRKESASRLKKLQKEKFGLSYTVEDAAKTPAK